MTSDTYLEWLEGSIHDGSAAQEAQDMRQMIGVGYEHLPHMRQHPNYDTTLKQQQKIEKSSP